MSVVQVKIHQKEKLYYRLLITATILLLIPTILFSPFFLFVGILILVSHGMTVGYLKGNGVEVTGNQFAEINRIILEQCNQLGIKKVPNVYIVESGFLNAFAMRFIGSDYMILYSELAELILDKKTGKDIVRFVIAHELTHIKRKHVSKKLYVFPALLLPFLSQAYSRACEYTCDATAARISPKGAVAGIKVLAVGTELYHDMDAKVFAQQSSNKDGFWSWWAEKMSTHPHLSKRLTTDLFRASFVSHASGKNMYEVFGNRTEPKMKAVGKIESAIESQSSEEVLNFSENHEKYLPKIN